jgi:hypothetical protein
MGCCFGTPSPPRVVGLGTRSLEGEHGVDLMLPALTQVRSKKAHECDRTLTL